MGAYLSAPITEKESCDGESEFFKYGVTAMQGWRTEMEDAHAAVLNIADSNGKNPETGYFAVFDGHGGKEVAKFAAKYLAAELVKSEAWRLGNLQGALADTYLKIDEILEQEDSRNELTEMAGGNNDNRQWQPMAVGEDDRPELQFMRMRNCLIEHIKEHSSRYGAGADDDEDWGGDEFEDPDFNPLVELDQDEDARADLGETNVMTRDDSDEESTVETAESSDDSGQEDMLEGPPAMEGSSGPEAQFSQEQEYQGPAAGCTAVVALVRGDTLVVANAGDSRCVCSRGGTAVAMTNDHKPTDTEEHERITKAGGFISDGRVNGSLNLSRALGDLVFKRTRGLPPAQQMITAMPEIRTMKLQPGDEFLILACDGIWDVVTNQQAVDFVRERLQGGMDPRAICEALCDACLAPDTNGCGKGCDNMSAMVVLLKQFAPLPVAEGASPVPPAL